MQRIVVARDIVDVEDVWERIVRLLNDAGTSAGYAERIRLCLHFAERVVHYNGIIYDWIMSVEDGDRSRMSTPDMTGVDGRNVFL